MSKIRVTPNSITSPIFRVKGQRSKWRYPHERLTPEHCKTLTNINIGDSGIASSRSGYAKYVSSLIPNSERLTGIFQATWEKNSTTSTQVLVCTPTKVYWVNGLTLVDITGSLTLSGGNDNRYRAAFFRNSLVATDGVNESWYKDSDFTTPTNATALTGMPWSTCEDFVEHKGLLFALNTTEGGVRYSTRIRWCDLNTRTFVPDISIWPDTNRYEMYEGGTQIVGGVDNFGYLMIFKTDGMYPGHIEYQQGYIEFRADTPVRGFSPIAKCSLIARPEFVFGVAKEGAFILDSSLKYTMVTEDVQDIWDSLSQSRLPYAQSYIRQGEHQVRTLLSSGTNTDGHDLELVWDWDTGNCYFDEPKTPMTYKARAVLSSAESVLGGTTGYYLVQGNTGTEDDGSGIAWEISMAPNDLGYPGRDKQIIFFRTIYKYRDTQGAVQLLVSIDEGSRGTRKATLPLAYDGAEWNDGTTTWNDGTIWDQGGVRDHTFFINRLAQTVQPQWIGSSPADIVGYQVEFTLEE